MGELTVGPKIIDQTVQRRMRSVLKKICSGQFAREFIREMKTGRKHYAQLLREAEKILSKRWVRDCAEWWLGGQKYKTPSALPCRQHASTGEIVGVFGYLPKRWPKIVIELAVVGIAASRSQGCGIAELPATT